MAAIFEAKLKASNDNQMRQNPLSVNPAIALIPPVPPRLTTGLQGRYSRVETAFENGPLLRLLVSNGGLQLGFKDGGQVIVSWYSYIEFHWFDPSVTKTSTKEISIVASVGSTVRNTDLSRCLATRMRLLVLQHITVENNGNALICGDIHNACVWVLETSLSEYESNAVSF